MSPVLNRPTTQFSPCSIGNVCQALGQKTVQSSCLVDRDGPGTPNCGGHHLGADKYSPLIVQLAIWLGILLLYLVMSGVNLRPHPAYQRPQPSGQNVFSSVGVGYECEGRRRKVIQTGSIP